MPRVTFPLLCLLLLAPAALGDGSPVDARAGTPAVETGDFAGETGDFAGKKLDGRELYDRFLGNRLRSAIQDQRIISRDPGGSEQVTRFRTIWRDYRDEETNAPAPPDDLVAKVLLEFTHPFDMRHTTYLMFAYDQRASQQWVYRPSARRVSRVRLNSVSIMGTDFDYSDFGFKTIDDAEYRRLPDTVIDGVPAYVVEAWPKSHVDTQYSRSVIYMEQDRYVLLRSRAWDKAGVAIRELVTVPASIRQFDGVWIATEATMTDLLEGTSSTLYIEKIEANTPLADKRFALTRLDASGH